MQQQEEHDQQQFNLQRQIGLFLLKSKEIYKLPRTVMDIIFQDVGSLYSAASEELSEKVVAELHKCGASATCIDNIRKLVQEICSV